MSTEGDIVSGLKTQRDSALRRIAELEGENRFLRAHQDDIRTWLATEIDRWSQVRDTKGAAEVADEIHRRATELLGEAHAAAQRVRR